MSLNEKIIEHQLLGAFYRRMWMVYGDANPLSLEGFFIKAVYQEKSADQYRLARLMMGITE